MESARQSKKRPSLGKNNQATINDIATVAINEREITRAIPENTSKIQLSDSGLKYIYTNADQLLNKIDDLKMLIADDNPDVIMVTEVIPKAQKNPIPDVLLNIEGYELYKNFKEVDSNLGASGRRGVAIYVMSILICKEITTEIALHNDQV